MIFFLAKIEVNAEGLKLYSHVMFSQPILTYVDGGKGMQSDGCIPTAST